MGKKIEPPLFVEVTESRWNAVGERTRKNAKRYKILNALGGINETTTPGWYTFDYKFSFRKFGVTVMLFPCAGPLVR